jgi:hypothetical protein
MNPTNSILKALRTAAQLFSAWIATVAMLYLMLVPGDDANVEGVSSIFGGTDTGDWFGHVVMFGILAALWMWFWRAVTTPERAVKHGLRTALWLGVLMETMQIVAPGRGANVLDLIANLLGAYLAFFAVKSTFAAWYYRTPVEQPR